MENLYTRYYRQREWTAKNLWRYSDYEIEYDTKLKVTQTKSRLNEAFPDPPNDEFDLQLLTGGHVNLDHLDCGFGRDSGKFGRGSWAARPSGAPLNVWGTGEFALLTLSFPWQRLANDINQETGRDVSHLGRVHEGMRKDSYVEVLATQLWNARHSETLHKDSLITMLIHRLWRLSALGESDQDRAKHPLDKDRLKRVIEYLHSQFLDPLSLKDVADIAGLSKYHLLRAFKESTGLTPHAYLRRLRANHGKKLLEKGHSFIDAAYAAGFADQAHFTRTFKTFYRLTPGQYFALCRS